MVVILSVMRMQHFASRSFSRPLNGRTRTATLTLSPSSAAIVPDCA